jgi:exonuclease SbcC
MLLSNEDVEKFAKEKKEKIKEGEALHKEVEKVQKDFETKSKEVDALDKALKALQTLKDAYVKLGADLELLKSNLANLQKNKAEKEGKLNSLKLKAAQYEKEKPLHDEYKAVQATIESLQKQKEQYLKKQGLEEKQVILRKQYEDDKKEILELRKKVEIKPQLIKDQEEQNKLLEASAGKIKEIENTEGTLNKEIAGYQSLIHDTNKKVTQIQNIGKDSNCPTCTRPLLEEYDNVIASLQATITQIHTQEIAKRESTLKTVIEAKSKEQEQKATIDKALKELGEKLSVLSADEKTLAKKEEEFKSITAQGLQNKEALEALKDLKYDEKVHSEALAKKEKLEPQYKELLGLQKLIEQIPVLETELKALEVSIVQIQENITKQTKAIAEHSYDAKEHEKQELLYTQVRKEKDAISEELSKKKVEHTEIMGKITTLKSQLERNEAQKKQLQSKLDDKNDYDKLKAFMGEFKNKINSQIAPRISQLASEMYGSITRGKYQHIEVSNEFDFFIYDDGVRYPIERFSGGEVDLANLVLRIAISKTLSELSGSGGVGFLAFDEVFGSQDEERRFEIMEAFHTIKEQYRQIFLISHESEIKEMFERVVEL